MSTSSPTPRRGPVIFAYDGSELAKLAIDEAARQLGPDATRSSSPYGSRSRSGSCPSAG